MDGPATTRAVEDEPPEIALKVGFHLQQLQPKHFRLNSDGMGAVESSVKGLVDKRISLPSLLAQSLNGPFEDVPLQPTIYASLRHRRASNLEYLSHCRSVNVTSSFSPGSNIT
jgi:hypothetical protein